MSEKSPNRLEYICDQCDNWYKCRKELEDHRERSHKEYNCDQCDNRYEIIDDVIVSHKDNMYMDFLKNTFVLFHKRKELS